MSKRVESFRIASSPWHALTIAETLSQLSTSSAGLSTQEAADRLEKFGPNELQSMGTVSPWTILLEQFQNILVVILLIAVVLSVALGHTVEAIAIGAILLFAVLLGFVQEYRAERAIHALRAMAAPMANVIRNQRETTVPAQELVPGDIIVLTAGNKIPADGRLIDVVNLQIEEAALTGESVPVEKQTSSISDLNAGLGDRTNMVYAGTMATYGRGRAVVVGTGMQTEFGKIASMLHGVKTARTPLQESLDRVGRSLAKAALAVVLLIVVIGLWRGQPVIEMLIFGIALAVAVVPEALPAVVTISLAIGVQRMAKRNALMRRLPAVETLGSTSVICSDKTGTLTKDEMTVRKIVIGGETWDVTGAGYEPVGQFLRNGAPARPSPALVRLLRAATLVADTRLVRESDESPWNIVGDPTEGAIVVAAAKAGIAKESLDAELPRRFEIPFSSESKRMTTLHGTAEATLSCSKGAPEVILERCDTYVTSSGDVTLEHDVRGRILEMARQLAGAALRVLAIADKPGATEEDAENGLTFLGLVGMIDPPRPEAQQALRTCESAGIKVVMITGDHPETAHAVARELGVLKSGRVITGGQLEAISDEEFERDVHGIEVYARVSPAHKLRVVAAFQKQGHIVAMTGDGVNDAPALKKADIGIAMGITGTDVTREAAAMMLLDDNFASIVAAVEEGRVIFGNIKKYLMYLLSSNIGEIGLMLGTSIAGLPLPLTAVQILYINLATDGLPALALAVDPPEPGLMRRPPRASRTGIFTRSVVTLMLIGGFWSAAVNVGLFAWELRSGRNSQHAMTMIFVSLVLIEFFKAFNFRSDRNSIFIRPFQNRWLNLAIVWEVLLLVGIVYIPFLQRPFQTFSLSFADWCIALAVAATITPVLEVAKWCERRGWFGSLD